MIGLPYPISWICVRWIFTFYYGTSPLNRHLVFFQPPWAIFFELFVPSKQYAIHLGRQLKNDPWKMYMAVWTMFKVGSQFWQIFFWELFQMIHLAHITPISTISNHFSLTFQHISIIEYHRPICICCLPQPRCGFVSDWTSQRVCCSNGAPYQTPRRKSRGVLCRVDCHEKPSLCDT